MNKKGIELSINFLIVLFLSIIILIGGIAFTNRFMNVVEEREATVDEQTKRQIESLLMDGHQVAVPIDTLKIDRGQHKTFGLGIYNTLEDGTDDFRVAVKFRRAYLRNGDEMQGWDSAYINENWIHGLKDTEFTIEPNKYELVPIPVSVKGDMGTGVPTKFGTYEFDVCVCPCRACSGATYCLNNCIPGNQNLYGGHIMKLYAQVFN